jgi:hypothetical protein
VPRAFDAGILIQTGNEEFGEPSADVRWQLKQLR